MGKIPKNSPNSAVNNSSIPEDSSVLHQGRIYKVIVAVGTPIAKTLGTILSIVTSIFSNIKFLLCPEKTSVSVVKTTQPFAEGPLKCREKEQPQIKSLIEQGIENFKKDFQNYDRFVVAMETIAGLMEVQKGSTLCEEIVSPFENFDKENREVEIPNANPSVKDLYSLTGKNFSGAVECYKKIKEIVEKDSSVAKNNEALSRFNAAIAIFNNNLEAIKRLDERIEESKCDTKMPLSTLKETRFSSTANEFHIVSTMESISFITENKIIRPEVKEMASKIMCGFKYSLNGKNFKGIYGALSYLKELKEKFEKDLKKTKNSGQAYNLNTYIKKIEQIIERLDKNKVFVKDIDNKVKELLDDKMKSELKKDTPEALKQRLASNKGENSIYDVRLRMKLLQPFGRDETTDNQFIDVIAESFKDFSHEPPAEKNEDKSNALFENISVRGFRGALQAFTQHILIGYLFWEDLDEIEKADMQECKEIEENLRKMSREFINKVDARIAELNQVREV